MEKKRGKKTRGMKKISSLWADIILFIVYKLLINIERMTKQRRRQRRRRKKEGQKNEREGERWRDKKEERKTEDGSYLVHFSSISLSLLEINFPWKPKELSGLKLEQTTEDRKKKSFDRNWISL